MAEVVSVELLFGAIFASLISASPQQTNLLMFDALLTGVPFWAFKLSRPVPNMCTFEQAVVR